MARSTEWTCLLSGQQEVLQSAVISSSRPAGVCLGLDAVKAAVDGMALAATKNFGDPLSRLDLTRKMSINTSGD